MIRRIIEAVLAIAFFTWGMYFANENLKPELIGMSIGIAGIFITEIIIWFIREWKFLRLYLYCTNPFGNKELRLSIAYLYRIEVNGKYLLIRNRHFPTPTYQPVGGVYKYFNPDAKNELNQITAIADTNINDNATEHDLRLKLLHRADLRKFLNWFFSSKQREIDPWREFYEELIKPGILPQSEFGFIYYELVGQHFENIHLDKHFKIDTFKYADIYVPRFANHTQETLIKQLAQSSHPDFIWVTQDEIMKEQSNQGHRIAPHTFKIFYNKKLEL